MSVKMKDSNVSEAWIAEQMRTNPPRLLPNGNVFSGPVRLSFANIFKPGKPNEEGGEGKFGASLLFPPGTDFTVFNAVWLKAAKEGFPQNWDAQGQPVGLHSPFHRQDEKAIGPKPMAGYTPGAIYFACTSKFQPPVVDGTVPPRQVGDKTEFVTVTDESRAYSGVWAFVTVNTFKYGPPRPKKGIAFGLQTVMLIADDTKLGGGGGNPTTDFAGVTITATANVAEKFGALPGGAPPMAGPVGGIMPAGGHVGVPGNLPVQPLVSASAWADLE